MKKIAVLAALFVSVLTLSLNAETISADDLSIYRLKNMISADYGCKIDEDGDLMINGNKKLYVQIIPKAKMLCFSARFTPNDDITVSETIRRANKFNNDKRFLRICIEDDGTSVCDYYMVYDGGVNSENFKETVSWFDSLVKSWVEALIAE